VARPAPEPEAERPARREEARPSLRRPARRGPKGLTFGVFITRDSDRELRGRVEAELSDEGLYLYKGDSSLRVLPGRGTARYRGGNRFALKVEGRQLELTLIKGLPWYLSLMPLLALGIPALALPFEVPSDDSGFAALWVFGSLLLLGLGYLFLYGPRWPLGARLGTTGGLLGLGYLGLLIAFLVSLSSSATSLPTSMWRLYDGRNFMVEMPGWPRSQEVVIHGNQVNTFTVDLPRYQVNFTVEERRQDNVNHEVAFNQEKIRLQPPASPAPARERIIQQWPTPCREWVYQYRTSASRGLQVVRVYIAKGQMFTLIARGPWRSEHDPDVRKFMDSFVEKVKPWQ
jgi:hypothetical protein